MPNFTRLVSRYIVPASNKTGGLRLVFDIEGTPFETPRLRCIVS